MCCTLWGLARGVDICQGAGLFLNPLERTELETARKAAFVDRATLAHEASVSNSLLWHNIPKCHYLDHIYRCVDGLNPTCGWTFADEDWIGSCIRINHRSCDGNKLVRKYVLRLHLMLAHNRMSIPEL